MAESTIERITKAIEDAAFQAAEYEDEHCSPEMAKAAALAALSTLREPTEGDG